MKSKSIRHKSINAVEVKFMDDRNTVLLKGFTVF